MVIEGTNLVAPALSWDLDFLKDNLGDSNCSVYESRDHVFKYFDEKKVPSHPDFQPQMRRLEMKFGEFVDRLKASKPDDKR